MAGVNMKSDFWKLWERNGKNEFVKNLKLATKNGTSPAFCKTDIRNGIFRPIYDLLMASIRGQCKKDCLLVALQELSNLHADIPSIILDVIGIIDAETLSGTVDGIQDDRTAFCTIVRDVEKIVSDKLLKERLEIDTLQDVGIIKTKHFYTKFIKVKTKLYYKQRRFNLFREESEGYAKLITELNHEPHATVHKLLDIIKSLIGCFNLDPNRVLDIILESFESHPEQHRLFVALLREYMPNGMTICEVLGYKFRYFSDQPSTPKSLYTITALLLQNGIISLNDIYLWLNPNDKSIILDWDTEVDEAKEFVRKLNVIATNKDSLPAEPEVEKEWNEEKYIANQKWNLCASLLKVGDYKTAVELMDRLPKQSVLVNIPVARSLANLIHNIIDPIYKSKCSVSPKSVKSIHFSVIPNLSIPTAQTFADLRLYAFPMAIKLGPSLYTDPVLMYKLIRLMRSAIPDLKLAASSIFQVVGDDEMLYDIYTLLDSSILPALSYMDWNCCVAEEVWSVIKNFPYHYRYSLYGRWKNDNFMVHPQLIRRRGGAQKQIKALMKRVSKENVKPVGRLIGKLSHCSPGFLFEYILVQIQTYDNLIGPVVDSLKFLTSLSYDVLGYCIIESLAQADRNLQQQDGTSLSLRLQSLANFCGSIYKKYNIELSGLLQYVANQLKAHKSLDLVILKEVVQKMAGIEATEEMTNEQLHAISGGELLRSEAGYFSQVRNTKKSSQRLKDALASNDLSVALCLLMAQQKHCVIYRETANNHLKLVGKLYDQCQDTLVQFGTFLGSTYSVDEYVDRLPSIHSMLQEYHIHSDVAFFLARPMFTHQINQKYDQLRKSDPNVKKLTTGQKLEKYLEATAHIIAPIVQSVRPLHSPKVWDDISPQFLVTFWSLGMCDLQVPVDSYQKEVNKLKQSSLAALDSKEINGSKGRKEQERYLVLIDKLQDERKKQQEHVDKILHRLKEEKDLWFLSRSAKSAKNDTITQFLQLCLFPRCTFTALDAVYCAKFVHTIHTLKTVNFSTLLCYDRIFCDITYSVTSFTENEATRYGRFLCAMLETVMKWHSNPTVFNRECANYPGFVTKFRVSNQFSETSDDMKIVGYENYRHVCHKWHYKITKAMVFCLDSKDYMQIRNALIILMRILPYFPMLVKPAQIIEKKVEKVREEERNQRQDLFVLASSYIGQLKAKSGDMKKEGEFHLISDKPASKETTGDVKPVNGSTGQEPKEISDRPEKKVYAKPIQILNSSATVPKDSASTKKESTPVVKSESRADSVSAKERSRESKKEERAREKEDSDSRKRDKEKRRDRKAIVSPHLSPMYDTTERYAPTSPIYIDNRDRDLSSISNSSHGSNLHRTQESPEHDRDTKRRKIDLSSSVKKSDEQFLEEIRKEAKSSKSKEKRDKSSTDDGDGRKEKKTGRKRDRLTEEALLSLEQKRRKEEDKTLNGEDDARDKHYNIREKSPYSRERSHEKLDRDKLYSFSKSSRSSRSGY